MSKLQAALDLAALGFRVFPLQPNGKTPAIDADWRQAATCDPTKINRLWTDPVFETERDYNVGIALDSSTLVVDVDVRDDKQGAKSLALLEAIHGEMEPTYEVRTASGGRHLYYRVPDSRGFPKTLATHIDLKGEGGYVVGPGSTIDGRSYQPHGGGEVRDRPAMAPEWLRDFRDERRTPPRDRVATGPGEAAACELDSPAAVARAKDWLERGAPDHGTFKVACRVKDFGVSEAACLDLMTDHWSGADAREHNHIAFRVANAYRYGQSAPGVASPEAEFDAVNVENPTAARKGRLWFETWDEAQPDLQTPYLIDDVYDLNTMVVTYGESNSGKTYVVLDQAFAIAAGRPWNGHKVRQGLVVYVAAEGGRGFRKRVAAFRKHYGAQGLPFALVPCPVDLFASRNDAVALVALVHEAEARFGQPCAMVVVDTLARAMGGGDENSGADMGVLLKHCDRIREATGASFHLIHHSGKDKAKGARGWSGLRGHIDTEIEVSPGQWEVTKQRDLEKQPARAFALVGVEVGRRADGKAVTACVVDWRSEFDVEASPGASALLQVLAAVSEGQDEDEFDEWVRWKDWQDAALGQVSGDRGKPVTRTGLYPLRKELEHLKLVESDGRNRWRVNPTNPDKQA